MVETFSPLLTPNEAAKLLGISPSTLAIWRCTKRYHLRYVKCGRVVRYPADALAAFIAERTVDAGEPIIP
jgi:excisionase family DNA binding protein